MEIHKNLLILSEVFFVVFPEDGVVRKSVILIGKLAVIGIALGLTKLLGNFLNFLTYYL